MSEKQRIKTECVECKEEFTFYAEPKGVVLISCPFCPCKMKIVFEDNSEKVLFRCLKVEG